MPRQETALEELKSFKSKLATILQESRLDGNFFSSNFLELNFYICDLRIEEHIQQEAYSLFNLLSDIGSSMGLLIGA
ncbi:hypothetical protein LSAT2_030913, partial [Lamellibrachia satsuma]